jgi:hypothetical protein
MLRNLCPVTDDEPTTEDDVDFDDEDDVEDEDDDADWRFPRVGPSAAAAPGATRGGTAGPDARNAPPTDRACQRADARADLPPGHQLRLAGERRPSMRIA